VQLETSWKVSCLACHGLYYTWAVANTTRRWMKGNVGNTVQPVLPLWPQRGIRNGFMKRGKQTSKWNLHTQSHEKQLWFNKQSMTILKRKEKKPGEVHQINEQTQSVHDSSLDWKTKQTKNIMQIIFHPRIMKWSNEILIVLSPRTRKDTKKLKDKPSHFPYTNILNSHIAFKLKSTHSFFSHN